MIEPEQGVVALPPQILTVLTVDPQCAAQAVIELAQDKESLLVVVTACKDAQGAYLDLVHERLYSDHLKAVAGQVCRLGCSAWRAALGAWGLGVCAA